MFQVDNALRENPQGMSPVRYITNPQHLNGLSAEERSRIEEVSRVYGFRATDYYLNLIDWRDPHDPIRQLIVPRSEELASSGSLDASNEAANTVARGAQHKYPDTVVLLCCRTCGGFCRYCFRKRLFMNGNEEVELDLTQAVAYIKHHPEVTNVLLTGGDPLLLSTARLGAILEALGDIPHVRIIRIGTKVPAFNPYRVLEDECLHEILACHSTPRKRIYIMTHFDHPRELTDPAIECVDRLIRSGVICANQCPLIRGVNADPAVLSDLFRNSSWIGCAPYYVFQMRPTIGNEPYQVPIVEGWEIFREALRYGSGLARRARFVMSHETGKVEILGVDSRHIYLRYHRAKSAALRGRFLSYKRDDQAAWLDDLIPADESDSPRFAASLPLKTREGPE